MTEFRAYFKLELLESNPIPPMVITAKNETEARKIAADKAIQEWDWENIEEMLEPIHGVMVSKVEKLKEVI